ncbi:MAG: sugar ABC transporter permease [Clostridia bacterium]|nr:sugar ABC transporter permease [Clostridia bacterium]
MPRRFKLFLDRHSVSVLQAPFIMLFAAFIIIPILMAIGLSFTDFNTIQMPNFVGLNHYVSILTDDQVFMEYALPNTIQFAIIVGIGGYILSFFMAWSLAQITKIPRTILAIILYSPSMTGGVMLSAVWRVIFDGDKVGLLNAFLLRLDAIQKPIVWLQDPTYLLPIMILVSLWSSMGIGFLAMLAGVLNVNRELYEAAYIDGVHNRFQEIRYVTIPAARPQMLFGAVMAIVGTFQNGSIGVMLTGANPTPGYAGQLLVTHAEEHAFVRYEMGYGAAVSVLLLILVWGVSQLAKKLFAEKA